MGLFSKSSTSVKTFPWKEITSVQELNQVMAEGDQKPIVLFKHSTRCSISIMALSRFEKEWNVQSDGFDLYYIDLLAHRDVSNEIETNTHVQHQSPQAIAWYKNEVLYTATHNGISAKAIQDLAL